MKKRIALIAALGAAAGCSNAPVAGWMDWWFPSSAARRPKPPVAPEVFPPGERIPPTELGPPVGAGGPADRGVIVPGGN
jgi:hypothetical protein